jgi:N6-adenosine-specific RNA methylase IME4
LSLLPAIPDRGAPFALEQLEQIETDIVEALATIEDPVLLDEWRAQAAALEVYLRNRNLQGPMLGAQRRVEGRIGQLLKPYSRVGIPIHDPARADFRLLACALSGEVDLGPEEWRQSRRATVALVRKRLGYPEPELPPGQYRCIVIDPPWPVERVEQQRRPLQQAELDYPTMPFDEIDTLVGAAVAEKADPDGCHVYLWTTHRFLPRALEMYAGWGARYQCLLTWVKPTGVSPFSWMYDTEHVIFGRVGALALERMGLRLSIVAPATRGHSVKPDLFYERVMAASPGPRLEMFARSDRDGFVPWGNEVAA